MTKHGGPGMARQERLPSGRWGATAGGQRAQTIEECLGRKVRVDLTLEGLTELNTSYVGYLKARRRLIEAAHSRGILAPPSVTFETFVVVGEELRPISSLEWQKLYRDPRAREDMRHTTFVLRVTPAEAKLPARSITYTDLRTGETETVQRATYEEMAGIPTFEEQWDDEAEYDMLKRFLLKTIPGSPGRREAYATIRAQGDLHERFYERAKAEGFDWKAPDIVTPAPPPPKPADPTQRIERPVMLSEFRRILEGYGELPAPGTEAEDEAFQAFLGRAIALHGEEVRKPLLAALSVLQKEAAASHAEDEAQ